MQRNDPNDFMPLTDEWKMAVLLQEFEDEKEDQRLEDVLLFIFLEKYQKEIASHFAWCLNHDVEEQFYRFHKGFRQMDIVESSSDADWVIWQCLAHSRNFPVAFKEAEQRIKARSEKKITYTVKKKGDTQGYQYTVTTPQEAVLAHYNALYGEQDPIDAQAEEFFVDVGDLEGKYVWRVVKVRGPYGREITPMKLIVQREEKKEG